MTSHHLALVRTPPAGPPQPDHAEPPDLAPPGRPDRSELALVGAIFGLNLVPVAGELVHPGGWSPGIVAFAALAAVLSGRELWSQLRARRSERIEP